jgi:hypothetical protein
MIAARCAELGQTRAGPPTTPLYRPRFYLILSRLARNLFGVKHSGFPIMEMARTPGFIDAFKMTREFLRLPRAERLQEQRFGRV